MVYDREETLASVGGVRGEGILRASKASFHGLVPRPHSQALCLETRPGNKDSVGLGMRPGNDRSLTYFYGQKD